MSTGPTAFPSDPLPFLSFDYGFPPLDFPDNIFVSNYESSPNSNSGSGPDDPRRDHDSPNSNSTVSAEPLSMTAAVVNERKRKRMLSNRDSARRSRMRKQKHLENVCDQVSQLRLENREISNRLTLFLCHGRRLVFENYQLHYDNLNLRQKLSEVCKVMLLGQLRQQQGLTPSMDWTCNGDDIINVPSEHN